MTSRIAMIDEALVLNGSEPLGSEQAPGADTHLAAYENCKNLILTCHPWSFNTFTRELDRYSAPPDIHWKYAFDLPPDMLGSPRAYYDSADQRKPFTKLELFGDRQVRTDAERLWVNFSKDVPPGLWSAPVYNVVLTLLRGELAQSVREDAVLRKRFREEAIGSDAQQMQGGLLASARGIDDMSKPSPSMGMWNNPIIDVRRAGGG